MATADHRRRFLGSTERGLGALLQSGSLTGGDVRWTALAPSVNEALTAALDRLGVTVAESRHEGESHLATALSASTVVDSIKVGAWTSSVIRLLGAVTNLSVAHSRTFVRGSGPVALDLARRLVAMGARVVLTGDEPVQLLTAAQRGFTIQQGPIPVPAEVVFVFDTAESVRPLSGADFAPGGPVVAIDAALPVRATTSTSPTEASSFGRAGLVPLAAGAREVALLDAAIFRDSTFDETATDIETAFALHLLALATDEARRGNAAFDPDLIAAADAALAREVLA